MRFMATQLFKLFQTRIRVIKKNYKNLNEISLCLDFFEPEGLRA